MTFPPPSFWVSDFSTSHVDHAKCREGEPREAILAPRSLARHLCATAPWLLTFSRNCLPLAVVHKQASDILPGKSLVTTLMQ